MEENQFKKDNDRTTAGQLTAEEHNNIGQELNNMLKTHLGFDAEDLSQLAKGLWIEGRSLLYTDVSDVSNKIHLKRLSSEHKIEILKDGVSVFFQCRENSTGVVTIKLNETEEKPVNFRGVSAGLVDANKLYVGVTYLAVYRDGFDTTKEIGKWDLFEMSATLENVRFKRETTNNKVRIIVDDNAVPLSLSMNPGDNATEFEQGAIIAKSQASFLFSDVVAGNKNNKLGIKYEVESPGDDGAGNPLPEEHSLVFYAKNENKGFINMSTGYHNLKRRMPYAQLLMNVLPMSSGEFDTSPYSDNRKGISSPGSSNSWNTNAPVGQRNFYERSWMGRYGRWRNSEDHLFSTSESGLDFNGEKQGSGDIYVDTGKVNFKETGIYKVELTLTNIWLMNNFFNRYWSFALLPCFLDHLMSVREMYDRKYPGTYAPFSLTSGTSYLSSVVVRSYFYNGMPTYRNHHFIKVEEDTLKNWSVQLRYHYDFFNYYGITNVPYNVKHPNAVEKYGLDGPSTYEYSKNSSNKCGFFNNNVYAGSAITAVEKNPVFQNIYKVSDL